MILWILFFYFILLIFFLGFSKPIGISLWIRTQFGLSRNLQGCIVPVILPVPRVIRHTARTQLSSNVSLKTSSRLCNIIANAHYLSQLFLTVYVALQY